MEKPVIKRKNSIVFETKSLLEKRSILKDLILKEISDFDHKYLAEQLGLLPMGVEVLLDNDWSLDDIFVICQVMEIPFSVEIV